MRCCRCLRSRRTRTRPGWIPFGPSKDCRSSSTSCQNFVPRSRNNRPYYTEASNDATFQQVLALSPLSAVERGAISDIGVLERWRREGIQPNPKLEGKKVAVLGGSFAGLMTATALSRLGLDVTVFETFPSLRVGGAGIGIEDTSLACLEAFGLGGDMRRKSLPMRKQVHVTSNGEIFRSDFPYYSCYWDDIYKLLYKALPNGILRLGTTFTNYRATETGIEAEIYDNQSKSTSLHTFDALIGCDGPTSRLRSILHPKSELSYRGYTAWRGHLDVNSAPKGVVSELYKFYRSLEEGALYFHVGDKEAGHLVVYELPENGNTGKKINLLWYLPSLSFNEMLGSGKDVGRDRRITIEARQEEVQNMHQNALKLWPKPVAHYIQAVPDPFLNDIYDMAPLPTEEWGKGPVTLVGDAAHAVTPHFLKSSNMAICDATELAIRLEQMSETSSIAQAFRSYEKFRHPFTVKMLAVSRQLGMARQGLMGPATTEEWDKLKEDEFIELMGDCRPACSVAD